MPITISDKIKVRPTIDYKHIPCQAAVDLVNPGPVSVPLAGSASAGNALVEPAEGDAGRDGYLGFNVMSDVAAGTAPSVLRHTIVEGLAGVEPGKSVYITDDLATDTAGITHTKPATGDVQTPIGKGLTTSKVWID